MATEVKMPKLSDNMEEGTIIRWLKKPGDSVRSGEPLAEVETDKADVEVEANDSGVLGEIRVAEGQSAAVGETIAVLDGEGKKKGRSEDAPAAKKVEGPAQTLEPEETSSDESTASEQTRPDPTPSRATTGDPKPAATPGRSTSEGTVRASPLARRLAEEAAVNLATVQGTGPGGRILKRDVEAAVGSAKPGKARGTRPTGDGEAGRQAPAAEKEARQEIPEGKPQLQEPSRTRQTIAKRMAEAKRDIPHFYVGVEIDMTETMRLRRSIKDTGSMPGLTVTHLLVKALAVALVDHPRVNASWQSDGILFQDDVNIGVAVAVDDGLVVPVLHQAQRLSLQETVSQVRLLTDKARRGKFGSGDLSGGTFSLSNVGMLDVDDLVAVINPPQAAILAVGAVKQRPIVRDGQLSVAPTMRATLSCDHRVLNGVEGGEFLADVKRVLENPVMLLLA